MKMKSKLCLGLVCSAALLVGAIPAAHLPANAFPAIGMEMQWTVTSNWLACRPNSANSECANWQTPDGRFVYLSCCVPPSALGTSDFSACTEGGMSRDGRGDL